MPAATNAPRGSRLLWIALVLVGVVTMEVASRVEDRVVYGMPLSSRITSSSDLVLRDSIGARGRPNTVFRRWKLDSLGFRGPEVRVQAAPGTIRIVTTGASETFGLYEAANREYPRQLEDSLRAHVAAVCGPERAPRVEVVNAALPGMALPSLTRHLTRIVAPLRPSVVVLYPSPGFYLNSRVPQAAEALRADTSLPASKALSPRFVGRITTQLKTLAPDWALSWTRQRMTRLTAKQYPQDWRYTDVPGDRLDQYEEDLRVAVGAARSIGSVPILVGYVNATMAPGFSDTGLLIAWEYQFPRAHRHVIPAFHAQATVRIARVAADSNVAYVDLPRAFDGRWAGAFADFVHFTDAGSATVASALAAALPPRDAPSGVCKGQLAPPRQSP